MSPSKGLTGARDRAHPAAKAAGCPGYGLLVAAGHGSRYGGCKQLAVLKGKPVLVHCVRAFELCPGIFGYVVVVPKRRLAVVKRMLRAYGVRKSIGVVPGGDTRAESVRAGLDRLPDQGYVAVHDAVRPLIQPGMLSWGLHICRKRGAATYGYPVTDTIKRVAGADVRETVSRDNLIAVQTPQFFSLELLRRAHASALRAPREATDDCELVERLGVRPLWILGPRTNLKLTTAEDLSLLRALV